MQVVEKDVQVKTPDGTCDAVFVHPAGGTYPGVLIWTDALGLRPAFRDMAKRLAAEGFAVLVPNPYYRAGKAPVVPQNFSFENTEQRAKLMDLMSKNTPETVQRDATAYVAFLDAQAQVDKAKKIGTQGYCMGGALTMRTAATIPDRIGAGASFHGGNLVNDTPASPHLLVPKIEAKYHFGVAIDDDKLQPGAKVKLKEAFDAAKNPADIEVYEGALHGWCMKDMPLREGKQLYNHVQAERAWTKLLALYKSALG